MLTSRQRLHFPSAALLVLTLVTSASAAGAQGLQAPAEVRAIWVTRWDYKTELDVRRAVRWSAALGLNRVYFQVRGRADAFYRSRLEPWGEELGGRDPGFDPLQSALDEAHKSGIEIHAWVNVMPAWKGSQPPRDPNHLLYRHPEWFVEDSKGKRHLTDPTDYTILNPCLPEVRSYLVEVLRDIVTRYPIDGLHLDYVRFVGVRPGAGIDMPYDPRTLALFRKDTQEQSPVSDPATWNQWRVRSINTLVYRIQEAARGARPSCLLSVAALGDYERARSLFFQDVARWRVHGWVDEVCPMTYEEDHALFSYRINQALKHDSEALAVVPGIGMHLHSTAGQTARQIEIARALGARGYALFGFASLFPSPSHESRRDEASKKLRSALRTTILELNGMSPPSAPTPAVSRALSPVRVTR